MHVKVFRFDLSCVNCPVSHLSLLTLPLFFCRFRFSMTNRSRSTNLSITDPTQTNRSSRPLLQLRKKVYYNFRSSNSSVLVPKLLKVHWSSVPGTQLIAGTQFLGSGLISSVPQLISSTVSFRNFWIWWLVRTRTRTENWERFEHC